MICKAPPLQRALCSPLNNVSRPTLQPVFPTTHAPSGATARSPLPYHPQIIIYLHTGTCEASYDAPVSVSRHSPFVCCIVASNQSAAVQTRDFILVWPFPLSRLLLTQDIRALEEVPVAPQVQVVFIEAATSVCEF